MKKITPVLFQTNKVPIDEYVLDMIHLRLGNNWIYEFYDDKDIIQFFINNPIQDLPDIVEKYNSIAKGPHKADLFRYYYLYLKGGFFMDSDAMLYDNIDNIVKDYDFVSVNSSIVPGSIFQGLLGASPNNSIIKKALYYAYNTDPNILLTNYHHWCKQLYKIIEEDTFGYNIKLYKERRKNEDDGDDIIDEDGNLLFKHYWKYKNIPMLYLSNSNNEFAKIKKLYRSIVGYKYTWGAGTIMFKDAFTIRTTWGDGLYRFLDTNIIAADWNGFSHVIVFDQSYTKYDAICKTDFLRTNGSLISNNNIESFNTKYGKITLYSNETFIVPVFRKPDGYWDIDTLLKLKEYIDPNKNILEIGGHCGTSSVVYASFIKDNTKIHVYEPQEKMFNLLIKNIRQNNLMGKIIPYNMGVFCYNGNGKMNNIDIDGGGGTVEKRHNEESNHPCNFGGIGLGKDGENIYLVTIDSMNLSNIGFIHCDAQGAENFIFSKGLETIKKYRPVIYYEDNCKNVPIFYKNVCNSYPEYKEESVFDIKKYCMEELKYSTCIEKFNGGIDTLLIP